MVLFPEQAWTREGQSERLLVEKWHKLNDWGAFPNNFWLLGNAFSPGKCYENGIKNRKSPF